MLMDHDPIVAVLILGSLITPTYVLSAAHCILGLVDTLDIEQCIDMSAATWFINK